MKEGIVKYKKEDSLISVVVWFCECGQEMLDVGSAGCSHANEYTYIFQCPLCKTIGMSEKVTRGYGQGEKQFKEAGWVRFE